MPYLSTKSCAKVMEGALVLHWLTNTVPVKSSRRVFVVPRVHLVQVPISEKSPSVHIHRSSGAVFLT